MPAINIEYSPSSGKKAMLVESKGWRPISLLPLMESALDSIWKNWGNYRTTGLHPRRDGRVSQTRAEQDEKGQYGKKTGEK